MGATNNQTINTGGTNTDGNKISTSTENTSSARGTRGRTRGGNGGNSESKQSKETLELPNVKEPKIVSVDVPESTDAKPKATRGRPAGAKAKPKATANKKSANVDATHLILLLQTTSGILASREGMSVFALTRQEAEQIATPLAAILSKNETIGNLSGEYADHIALLIAAATIIIPKFLVYQATKPKKESTQLPKTQQKEVTQNERTIAGNSRKLDATNRNTSDVQNASQSFNGTIDDVLSPIGGF